MKRFKNICLCLAAIEIGVLSLSSCLPSPPLPPTPRATETFPTFTPIPEPASTITPTTEPTAGPASLELGQPFWIGRGQILDAVFLPGAKQVAIAWGSGVSLDVVETGKELWFQPTPTNVIAFDLQPQAKMLAAALADGSVMLFDASSGQPQKFKETQSDAYLGDIAWSPDGKTVAFQFTGPTRGDPIYLLDTASGQVSQLPNTKIDPSVVPVLVWSPDGSTLTVASLGSACPRLVDSHSGEDRMALGSPGQCYSDQALAWLPDGKLLAVPGQDSGVALLRFPEGNLARYLWSQGGIGVFPGIKRSLFIDPSGKWIATRGGIGLYGYDYRQPFIVWNLASGGVQGQITPVLKPLEGLRRMAATFDGTSILILYESGEITRWAFTDPAGQEKIITQILAMPPSAWTIRWSADSSRLTFSGRYGGVEVWDPAKGQLVRHFDPPLDTPALSPDGSKVALFDPVKNTETIYDVASGSPVRSIVDAARVLMGPAFSYDGRYLAYAAGGRARLADLESVQIITLEPAQADQIGTGMAVTRLIWAPNGQALVTDFVIPGSEAVGSGVIILWKRSANGTFEEVYHVANVQAGYAQSNSPLAIFNPSGSRVALQSYAELGTAQGQMMVVYDLAAQKAILTLSLTTAGAWANDDVLLLSSTASSSRLERINVVSGNRNSGSGFDRVNAYDPTGTYYMHEALTNSRGIVILQWQESDNTKITARGIFESNGLLYYGWSPDGQWAVAIGNDGTIRIWPVVIH